MKIIRGRLIRKYESWKKGASSNQYQLGCFFRSRVFAPRYIVATCVPPWLLKKNVDNEGTSFPVPIPIHEQWWLTLRFNWITRHEGLSEMCVTVPKKLPTLPLDIRTINGKCACKFLLRLIFFFLLKDSKILQFLNNLCRILIAKPWFFKISQEHLGISLSKKNCQFPFIVKFVIFYSIFNLFFSEKYQNF